MFLKNVLMMKWLVLIFLKMCKDDEIMTYLQILGLIVLAFFCVFIIVDRICKCFEQCVRVKIYAKYAKIPQEKAKNGDDFE